MRPSEIDQKFDAIVAFTETAACLDTPVKRFSIGVRGSGVAPPNLALPGRMRSRSYFQASSLRQSDLILVEGEQVPRFEMDCRRKMKDIQRSVSSGHGVP